MMFGLGSIKLAVAASIAAVVALAYWQYTVMKSDLAESQANVARMEVSVTVQAAAIEAQSVALAKWDTRFKEFQATALKLQEVRLNASAESRRLNAIFRKHNMEALSVARPDTLERLINRGTRNILGLFERETAGNLRDDGGSTTP